MTQKTPHQKLQKFETKKPMSLYNIGVELLRGQLAVLRPYCAPRWASNHIGSKRYTAPPIEGGDIHCGSQWPFGANRWAELTPCPAQRATQLGQFGSSSPLDTPFSKQMEPWETHKFMKACCSLFFFIDLILTNKISSCGDDTSHKSLPDVINQETVLL
jgi:hypothetical protein